jgi:porin
MDKPQIMLEVFYRLQISTHIAITPNLQYLTNPAKNTVDSSIFLWDVRGRVVL